MARKTSRPPEELPPPALTMSRADADAKFAARLDEGQKLREALARSTGTGTYDLGVIVGEPRDDPNHVYDEWNSYNVDMLKRMFTNSSVADEYSVFAGGVISVNRGGDNLHAATERAVKKFDEKLSRLRSIRKRLELIEAPATAQASSSATIPAVALAVRRAAFIVHGHDEAAREATARVLQQLGIDPIILHEQANRGQTIIEKFERHSDVPFAVVLLTPDDEGRAKGATDLKDRARQNVWFELGFFVGKLGRANVCALYKGPLEIPSDIQGVIYTPMDDGGAWRFTLAKELREAGISVDLNRL